MAGKKHAKPVSHPYEGLSGAQIGQKKLEEFEVWVAEVEHACSREHWKGKFAGTASREKIAIVRIPVNVTAVSGNVTRDSGDRDRGAVLRVF